MRLRPFSFLLAAFFLSFALVACSSDDDDNSSAASTSTPGSPAATATPGTSDGLKVGALLPLTGSLASYGETSKAALEEAVAALKADGTEVELIIKDTKTEPATALTELQALAADGVKVVIGPYSSSEVTAVKSHADQNGLILVSPLSTATSLAVANDNILRFTPDDQAEGVAAAALAYADGIRTIIPVNRDDDGNRGLQTAFKAAFEGFGGTVSEGITYGANETNFEGTVTQLISLLDGKDAATTGVYLTAFNEVTSLFGTASAADLDGLTAYRWYGSDSVAQSKELIEDATAATFAVAAVYPNPILGLDDADEALWGPVVTKLEAALNRTPDAFALAAYDALQVVAEAIADADDDASDEDLRDAIINVANDYKGLTGSTQLNDAGDRSLANYDFWGVCGSTGSFEWVRVASYIASTETATQHGC